MCAAITACASSGMWQHAAELVHELHSLELVVPSTSAALATAVQSCHNAMAGPAVSSSLVAVGEVLNDDMCVVWPPWWGSGAELRQSVTKARSLIRLASVPVKEAFRGADTVAGDVHPLPQAMALGLAARPALEQWPLRAAPSVCSREA